MPKARCRGQQLSSLLLFAKSIALGARTRLGPQRRPEVRAIGSPQLGEERFLLQDVDNVWRLARGGRSHGRLKSFVPDDSRALAQRFLPVLQDFDGRGLSRLEAIGPLVPPGSTEVFRGAAAQLALQ